MLGTYDSFQVGVTCLEAYTTMGIYEKLVYIYIYIHIRVYAWVYLVLQGTPRWGYEKNGIIMRMHEWV
jgi:hypothetical protein